MSHAYAHVDAAGFLCTTCPGCGGASHPATGCAYSPTFVFCWRCTLEAARWLAHWTAGKGRRRGGPGFYAHAARYATGTCARCHEDNVPPDAGMQDVCARCLTAPMREV